MAIQYVESEPSKAAEQIVEVVERKKAPAHVDGRPKFDRTTYQREYMRKRRVARRRAGDAG